MAERQSNLELLRLISMILILAHHYGLHTAWGNFELPPIPGAPEGAVPIVSNFNKMFVAALVSGGKVGVDIFLILSGYFLRNESGLRLESILRTWVQVDMWSWILLLGCWLAGRQLADWEYRVLAFPVLNRAYWFMSNYMGAALISPMIGAAAAHVSTPTFLGMLAWFYWVLDFSDWYDAYSNLSFFIWGILLGAGLRRYKDRLDAIPTKTLALSLVLMIGGCWYSIYCNVILGKSISEASALTLEHKYVFSVAMAVVIVLLVTRFQIHSATINVAAGCTLGVYLIHESPLIAGPLWREWIQGERWETSPHFPIIAMLQISFLYSICTLLEHLRRILLGPLEKWLASIYCILIGVVRDKIVMPLLNESEYGSSDVEKQRSRR